MKRYAVPAILAILLTTAILAVTDTNIVRDNASETVLWNSREAYLFVNIIHRGYRFSTIGYLIEFVKEYFYAGATVRNESYTTIAFKITEDGVRRYAPQPISFQDFRTREGIVYASHDRQTWKLGDTTFGQVSADEQQSIPPTGPRDFTSVGGWSRRTMGGAYEDLQLLFDGKAPATLRMIQGRETLSIDLERRDGKADRLVTVDVRARRVNRGEYDATFPEP